MFTAIDLDYIQILLPIIFFTIVLLFVSNSSLFNPHNNNVKKSPANSSFNAIDAQLNDDFRIRQKWEYEQVKDITAKYLEIGGEVYIGTDAPESSGRKRIMMFILGKIISSVLMEPRPMGGSSIALNFLIKERTL